jgi:glycosyltransferase involved in cell wall biosynthesis
MRVLQVTNFTCHLQLPLARSLVATLGIDNFRFAATDPPIKERLQMGWNLNESEPWILHAGEKDYDHDEFKRWWNEADVVITGCRNLNLLYNRVNNDKLTFYMSERWWKPRLGMLRLLWPKFALMSYRFSRLAQSSSFHYLPIGKYAISDMDKIASFKNRIWNWGYFTAVPDPLPSCIERDNTLKILWAGRMIEWKRVDTLVRAFALFLRQNQNAILTLIGDGPCRNELEKLCKTLGVTNNMKFYPSIQTIRVREQMRNSHIYVLPSSAAEGWGAVLNEAMSEGCCIVASEGTGSARTMIKHGENGLLFKPGNCKQLAKLLIQLNGDESLRLNLAKAGQKTIAEYWSPKMASERFLQVSEALLEKSPIPLFDQGPMAQI